MSGLDLFHATKSGMAEVIPRLAAVETECRAWSRRTWRRCWAVRFLVSEYGTGPVHGGRIDSLGLDENGSPVIVEFTDRR